MIVSYPCSYFGMTTGLEEGVRSGPVGVNTYVDHYSGPTIVDRSASNLRTLVHRRKAH